MIMTTRSIKFRLNGEEVVADVEDRFHAIDFLRKAFELSSPRVGCEHGVCGACSIRVNNRIIRGCLILGAQLDGCTVETVEGLTSSGEVADLQLAFHERNAMQCGFCTSGMLMASQELLCSAGVCSRAAIREHLSGNYCRCTGYEAIVDAVEKVAHSRGLKFVQEDL